MDTGLMGRVALVTGSTRGIGRAIAEALALEGADVIINGRKEESVMKVERDLYYSYNVTTYPCVVDSTDSQAIKDFFKSSLFTYRSQLDILVNNVGNIEKFGRFEDLDEEDWQKSFDLTCMSAVRFIKSALPYLKNSNQARIINISSISGHQPSGLNPHYGIAKAGMINLTKNLAQDFGRYGILVNTVCPSTIAGGGWHQNVTDRARRDGLTEERAEEIMRQEENKKSPLGRMGELENVADLVVFLSSNKSEFLTGHCYNVDGGITRSIL